MKHFTLFFALLCIASSLRAQRPWDLNVFNHLSVGVEAGTTGIGADVAMPACKFIQVRAGFVKMPDFKVNNTLKVSGTQFTNATGELQNLYTTKLLVQGKPKLANGLLMIDVLPIPTSTFHLTVGAYFGGRTIAKIYNREEGALQEISNANAEIAQWNAQHPDRPQKPIGLELGNYLLTPDKNGNLHTRIATKWFRPYVGLGYGRAVPRKRIGFRTDMGCLFWGKPDISCNGDRLSSEGLGGDEGKLLRVLSKLKVYPCINIRLCGRIF